MEKPNLSDSAKPCLRDWADDVAPEFNDPDTTDGRRGDLIMRTRNQFSHARTGLETNEFFCSQCIAGWLTDRQGRHADPAETITCPKLSNPDDADA
jgi:hypothetical protein